MNGPTYVLGVDTSQGMAALAQIQNKMKSVGDTARSELAQKLKTVFSVVAIEEAVRRTGEWALQLQNTAKQLGINSEALQALQLIARNTGAPEEAIVGMFENVSKSAQGAMDFNQELITSFLQLKITLEDIRNSTREELFGKF